MATIKQTDNIIGLLRQLVKGAGGGLFGNAIFFDIAFPNPSLAKANDVFINTSTLVVYQLVTSEFGNQWFEKAYLSSQTELNAHINNPTDAHNASAIYIYVRNVVSRSGLELIATDLENFKFTSTYIQFGREGIMKVNYEGISDVVGLFDYMTGTTEWDNYLTSLGIPTFNFASRITNPLYGFTVQNIIDQCMDILNNGNY